MQKRNALEAQLNAIGEIQNEFEELKDLAEMAEEEGDDAALDETQDMLRVLRKRAAKAEAEALLSGEADANDCFVEIHPGAGGTESNDWAAMLLRMYVRWAERRGMKVDVIEEQPGEEAGIKSAASQVKGHNAYGWLKTESGVHRLVRISPFDSNARRHTSFASCDVLPDIEEVVLNIDFENGRMDVHLLPGLV